MVLASEICLIDRTKFLSPFMELEETVFVWHVGYTAENGIP